MRRTVEVQARVLLSFPRRWWHLWRWGWHRHRTLLEPCWIKVTYTREDLDGCPTCGRLKP